jgi:phospholipid-binding lipoprotein MlaA
MTLALWGLPSGPFLFLPVFGPSNPRDAVGLGINAAMDPFTWVGQGAAVQALDWSRLVINGLDQRERHLDDIDVLPHPEMLPSEPSIASPKCSRALSLCQPAFDRNG